MASPKTYRVGPGTLKLGATGTLIDYAQQLKACTITWEKDKDDDVPVLSGDVLGGDTTYTAKLTGSVVQDLVASGLVDTTWSKRGTEVDFEFVPATAEGATITGRLILDPLDIGGDVKKRGESDFEWDCVGEPDLSFGAVAG